MFDEQSHQLVAIYKGDRHLARSLCLRYRPEILSDGPTVDRLSLYLSLREEHDERVQSALKELLESVRW
ncbi:MAG: hypothetical protein WCI20_07870 [bacterium]